MKPKLLYLITEDWFFCSHFIDRAVAMCNAGFDVVIATHVNKHNKIICEAGLRLVDLNMGRRSLNPFREMRTLVDIWKIYRSERPDIVHHVALKPVLYGSLIARLMGIRRIVNAPIGMGFIFTSDRPLAKLLRPVVLIAMRILLNPKGSKVIFENGDDLRALCENGSVRAENAVLIRGAGVDLSVFKPSVEPVGTPVVTLTARMLWDKGVGEYVEAAKILKAGGVSARFLLAGEPDDENPASIKKEQLKEWHDNKIIEWLGHCDDIPAILAASHIVCLPSYREGLPKSLLEALAAGKPIVTTDVVGCREAVIHGENGFMVPAKDSKKLAEALRGLIEDKELRLKFGAKGRAMAEWEFGTERVIAATRGVYEGMVG